MTDYQNKRSIEESYFVSIPDGYPPMDAGMLESIMEEFDEMDRDYDIVRGRD